MNSTMMGTALWPASTAQGLLYPRRVVSVNATAGTLTLDAPTRYRVLARDNARIVRPRGYPSPTSASKTSPSACASTPRAPPRRPVAWATAPTTGTPWRARRRMLCTARWASG
jgi:hypothetical protein